MLRDDHTSAIDRAPSFVSSPSKWEWLPVAGVVVLAIVHFVAAKPDGTLSTLSLYVGLGLVPGSLWRLLGRRSWNIHRACFAVSLIGFVLTSPELRPDAAAAAKIWDNWPLVAVGMLIAFTQPVWGALRVHRLLTDSGIAISRIEALGLCLVGSFFNIILPGSTGGDAYRVYAITRGYSARLAPAIASVTLDRLLGLPSLILVVLLGMMLDFDFFRANRILSKLIPFIAIAGAVCLVLVAYLAFAGKSSRRADGSNRERGTANRSWPQQIHDMIAANVTRPATLPLALFHGLMAHLACIVSCLCFGLALGVVGIPSLRYFLIVPMAMTINAIPGAPGGVGQGELAMATLLDLAAPNLGNAQVGVLVMLLFRLSNILLGLVGGVWYAVGKSRAGEEGKGASPEVAAGPVNRVEEA